jgi:hypothetical protein
MPSLGCTDYCRLPSQLLHPRERPVKISHRFKRALLGRGRGQTRYLTRVAFDDNFAAFVSQLVEDSTQIAGELSGFESSSSYLF